MGETKLVRATEMGFYNNAMVKVGTIFRVPASLKAKWFVEVVPGEPAPQMEEDASKKPEDPRTLSELAEKTGRRRKPVGVQPYTPLTTE